MKTDEPRSEPRGERPGPEASVPRFTALDRIFTLPFLLTMLVLVGCASPLPVKEGRRFDFSKDTFAYANQLVWEYEVHPETGEQSWHKRAVPPEYSHHCFVVVRSARQFWWHAAFDPSLPRTNDIAYRKLVRRVVHATDDSVSPPEQRVVFPGYGSLRDFSADHARLLHSECGGAWQSYVQRGHWRMVFPFWRSDQEARAEELQERIEAGIPCVVHVVAFPSLKINHALLLFDVKAVDGTLVFAAYDPNTPEHPEELVYSLADRQFIFPTNLYFVGGKVNVYEVYRNWIY